MRKKRVAGWIVEVMPEYQEITGRWILGFLGKAVFWAAVIWLAICMFWAW